MGAVILEHRYQQSNILAANAGRVRWRSAGGFGGGLGMGRVDVVRRVVESSGAAQRRRRPLLAALSLPRLPRVTRRPIHTREKPDPCRRCSFNCCARRRRALAVILAAMLVQTVMSLAAPWPLKIVIDTVIGNQRRPNGSTGC